MATKEQAIVVEQGSSPISLSMCFEQAGISAKPTFDMALPRPVAMNGGGTENALIPKGLLAGEIA